MIKLFLIVCLAAISSVFSTENHPIIYLISPPRSLSVAFTRMILQRGDFEVFSEPSQWAYALKQEKQWNNEKVFKDDAPASFAEVKERIYNAAKTKPVFVKEISFAVVDFILQDEEFVKNPQVHFIFLTRNPHHALISFYNKLQCIPHEWVRLVGYESQYKLFQYVKEFGAHKPLILHAEDLYQNADSVLKSLFSSLQFPYLKKALEWDQVTADFTGEDWHEIKYPEYAHYWHDGALNSRGFHKPKSYEVDDQGCPTFIEIAIENHRPFCKEAYEVSKRYYDLLLEEKEFTISPSLE